MTELAAARLMDLVLEARDSKLGSCADGANTLENHYQHIGAPKRLQVSNIFSLSLSLSNRWKPVSTRMLS